MIASPSLSQRGSSLFIILIAIALFAALSYALSRGGDSTKGLSNEKTRLLASDVIDIGNNLADATIKLRLHNIKDTDISFENSVVSGYTNAACTSDTCKVFAFDGGGKDWEAISTDVNGAIDMGITGDLAIADIGTSSADLVMIIPELSLDICNRINSLVGIDTTGTPTVIASATANKFTGTYSGAPTSITSTQIDGHKSGCFQITAASGTAVTGAPLADTYTFYQVLLSR